MAKRFYQEGLGLRGKKAFGNKFVMFGGEGEGSNLGMDEPEASAHGAPPCRRKAAAFAASA